ncbi:hypothetical protein GTQ43_35585 [Nostoc sp. KVJ3]|nr:hypothetical protein [Nostoc sp. KVJ3]
MIETLMLLFVLCLVKGLGIGGQTLVERELGWNRRTIRKGMQELERPKYNELFLFFVSSKLTTEYLSVAEWHA